MGVTRRRRLRCPECGSTEFDWTADGYQCDRVVFYDDDTVKTLRSGDLDVQMVTVECADCGRATDDAEDLL